MHASAGWIPTQGAMIAFSAYAAIAGVTGDWFPFTQVPMYASVASQVRTEAAVLYVLADGEPTRIEALTAFAGPDADDIRQWMRCRETTGVCRSYPCSTYHPEDAAKWVRTHLADGAEAGGVVQVEIGYRLLTARGDHGYDETLEPVWRGTARPIRR